MEDLALAVVTICAFGFLFVAAMVADNAAAPGEADAAPVTATSTDS